MQYVELGATFMLGYDVACFTFDGDQPQGARSPPEASPSFSSFSLQSAWECQEHPGLARQKEGTCQRSLEATLPRTEMDDKSPRKLMQGYGLG